MGSVSQTRQLASGILNVYFAGTVTIFKQTDFKGKYLGNKRSKTMEFQNGLQANINHNTILIIF